MSESFEEFQGRLEAGASAADELAANYDEDQQFIRVMKRWGMEDEEPEFFLNKAAQAFQAVAQEKDIDRPLPLEPSVPAAQNIFR